MVKDLTDQIIKYGEVRRGVLGVMGGELTTDLAKAFGYDKQNGAFVSQVMPGSAADNAGIKAGDIIVSINDNPVRSFGELRAKVATMGAGKVVNLGIIRDGKAQAVQVTLKQSDEMTTPVKSIHPALEGAKLENTKKGQQPQGVEVAEVAPKSPAAAIGLRKGDVIAGINRLRVNNMNDFSKAIKGRTDVLALNIIRGDSSLYLVLR